MIKTSGDVLTILLLKGYEMAEKTQDELLAELKLKADRLGIEYAPNIGYEKLLERVEAAMKDVPTPTLSEEAIIAKAVKDMKQPVLARVNDLDPTTSSEPTIIITVGNTYGKVGAIIRKGTEQLIPRAIIKALKAKTMVTWEDQVHPVTKRPSGNKVPKTSKKYSIEIINENPKV